MGQIKIFPTRQYKHNQEDYEGKIYELNFKRISVQDKPTYVSTERVMQYPTPLEARLRNFTYESELYLDIEYKIYKQKEEQE